MKQILLPLAATAAFIILVGIMGQQLSNNPDTFTQPSPPPDNALIINGKQILVEIADTEEKRAQGLSGRTQISDDEGMLFVFRGGKDLQPGFWMRDMLIPIDIIWIKDDMVYQINEKLEPPPPNTPQERLTIYSPSQPIDYVLEVRSGFAQEHNIKKGSKVTLPKL